MTRGAWPTVGLFLTIVALLTACASGIERNPAQAPAPGIASPKVHKTSSGEKDLNHPRGKVTVWSYYNGAKWIVPIIEAVYPDLDVEVTAKSWDNFENNYLEAVDKGNAPDVLFADNKMLRNLVGMNLFENLSAAPYGGESIAKRFNDATIAPYRFLSDNALFGLPLDIGPAVAYYRSDLFRKAGLPAEPEALGSYLEDPDHWKAAALKLKLQGSSIAFSDWDPIWMTEYSSGYFDRRLAFTRVTSAFVTAIDLARFLRKNGLASGLMLDTDEGRASLNDGKTAMFYNGWWYRNELKSAAPDTSGQWRMMRLPLGLYGWAGSSCVVISSSSSNKAGAWAVVRTLADHLANALEESSVDAGDPFFGGQKLRPLYMELVRRMPPYTPTPLDENAKQIWEQLIGNALESDAYPIEVLTNIKQLTLDSLQSDLDILKAVQHDPSPP
ncbi:extracellular solute-binding protein [Cohnella sp. CFH 77786]|uniref:ABC transporter substrate-binding protein n=1 Tax=Cohnella sp. CFH 77786 TaxID=2662265 RepID=UPI001C60F0ED|nr:extracellular solute-binding protein [Cohnella sp. CFH 77786]MBW5446142.1 extracellular solute-binding protein [Cohnella sp. CFH 77786]